MERSGIRGKTPYRVSSPVGAAEWDNEVRREILPRVPGAIFSSRLRRSYLHYFRSLLFRRTGMAFVAAYSRLLSQESN
jgi:hypothetical protein